MTIKQNASVAHELSEDGIVTVWFDSVNRSVNIFDAEMLAGLEDMVTTLAQLSNVRAVVFRSRKVSGFFAGADVHAIASITDAALAAETIRRGQILMQRVHELPMPTIAIIHGVCMGGGLEFALSCDFRLAADLPSTKLSLPEINLGLIPAWGGTQRLPRLIGLRAALAMILKGHSVSAAESLKSGLVDQLLEGEEFETAVDSAVSAIAAGRFTATRPDRKLLDQILDRTWLGQQLVLRTARNKIAKQATHYPATGEAISAVGLASSEREAGYAFECEAFTRLLFSPTARNLLQIFQLRDRARKIATWTDVSSKSSVEDRQPPCSRLAVIGAGAMGAGIGTLAATRGMKVLFKEIDTPAADSGRKRVEALLDARCRRGRMTWKESRAILKHIDFTADWYDLGDCDVAIEAVLEVEEVKWDVLQDLDHYLPAESLIASNTSSLNVTRMAMATGRPRQVAGLHFFNPVDRMELVEVVRTEATSDATIRQLLELVRALGKTPLVTSDKPGFLVNRVLFPYLGEAVRMVSEGYSIALIDSEMRAFGMPMGPLELLDQVGIDVASHVATSLRAIQPDAGPAAEFLVSMVERGQLGKKTAVGFYRYAGQGRPTPNGTLVQRPESTFPEHDFLDDAMTPIQRRLVYAMLNEAVHCLDELVVTEAWMVDLGMVLGTGFAPMRGGPLRLIDTLGISTIEHNMRSLMYLYGPRFEPADGIKRLARSRSRFFADVVSGELDESTEVSVRNDRALSLGD